jgi:hypothetical protein
MSDFQKSELEEWIAAHPGQFYHGCCCGADMEFHHLVKKVWGREAFIGIFPSTAKTRAPIPPDANFVAEPKPPLVRDKDIVRAGRDILLAAPLQMSEVLRSGTWSTVRFAKKLGVPVEMFWREPR